MPLGSLVKHKDDEDQGYWTRGASASGHRSFYGSGDCGQARAEQPLPIAGHVQNWGEDSQGAVSEDAARGSSQVRSPRF